MTGLVHDLRYALRQLLRQPGFTAVAVLMLALGIGANTAIFTVVNAVVLKPLPYPDADRVVYLGWDWAPGSRGAGSLTPLKFAYWREHARVFDGVATYRSFVADVGTTPEYDAVQGVGVSEDFFRVLGVRPALGRAFAPDEDRPGGPRVAILGHAFWRDRFGGDSAVAGRTLHLDGEIVTVVGVMPADYRFVGLEDFGDVLMPLQLVVDPAVNAHNQTTLARLKPGVTPPAAQADMRRVLQAFRAEHPEAADADEQGIRLDRYQDLFVGDLATLLWVLLGATLFVLLIACANVANLLLARATGRTREMATRAALGAGRSRIVRQLLTEGLVISALGGVVGLLVGLWSLDALLAAAPRVLPRADAIGLDSRVLVFALAIAVTTTLAFGLASALTVWRLDLSHALRDGGGSGTDRRRTRVRNALVVAEVAVSLVLLIGAGLLIASFTALRRVDPGFTPAGVLTARLGRAPEGYDSTAQIWRFERAVLERLRATPGISAAAASASLPFERGMNIPVSVVGRAGASEGAVEWRAVSPDYFGTLEIELLRGRGFRERDAGGPPVAIVSQAYASRYWPGGDAIGQRIVIGMFEGRMVAPGIPIQETEIVGIAADTREVGLTRPPARTVYVPQAQMIERWAGLPAFVVRVESHGVARDAVARAVHETDPRMPAPTFRAMDDLLAASLAPQRFAALLMVLFAAVALVLAALGIYGVVAYSVGLRRREIGLRIALGAHRRDVLRLVVGQGMRPVLIGLGLGLAASLAVTRVLSAMLYGVGARDPATFAVIALGLAAVALVAAAVPARRAMQTDPVTALRSE